MFPVLPATFGLGSVVLLRDVHAQTLTTLTSCSTGTVSTCQPRVQTQEQAFHGVSNLTYVETSPSFCELTCSPVACFLCLRHSGGDQV